MSDIQKTTREIFAHIMPKTLNVEEALQSIEDNPGFTLYFAQYVYDKEQTVREHVYVVLAGADLSDAESAGKDFMMSHIKEKILSSQSEKGSCFYGQFPEEFIEFFLNHDMEKIDADTLRESYQAHQYRVMTKGPYERINASFTTLKRDHPEALAIVASILQDVLAVEQRRNTEHDYREVTIEHLPALLDDVKRYHERCDDDTVERQECAIDTAQVFISSMVANTLDLVEDKRVEPLDLLPYLPGFKEAIADIKENEEPLYGKPSLHVCQLMQVAIDKDMGGPDVLELKYFDVVIAGTEDIYQSNKRAIEQAYKPSVLERLRQEGFDDTRYEFIDFKHPDIFDVKPEWVKAPSHTKKPSPGM